MTTAPPLADRAALAMRRRRADLGRGTFLHDAARHEVECRLDSVNTGLSRTTVIAGVPGPWLGWRPNMRLIADDDRLDFPHQGCDLIVHALALHWANDPLGQLIQCLRALGPGGFFMGVTCGGRTLHELRRIMATAEEAVTGGASPRVAPMGDVRDFGNLLLRAGFIRPVSDSQVLNIAYDSLWDLARDLRAMGEGNALAGRLRHLTRRRVFEVAAARYAQDFPAEGGGIKVTFELIFLAGWGRNDDFSDQLPVRGATWRQNKVKFDSGA